MAKRKLLPKPDTFHKNIGKIEEQSGKMSPSWLACCMVDVLAES